MRGRQRVADAQPRFDGGLNTVSDPSVVSETQVREARNLRMTEYGALTKRSGVAPDPAIAGQPLPSAVQGGFCWRRDNGTVQYLVVAQGILYVNGVAQSGSANLATSGYVNFAQFRDGANDVVYIADGGRINKWNGTTLSVDVGTGPSVRFIKVHNRRLWSCGCGTAPDSIFYSGRDDGDSLGDAGAGGGQIIVRTFGDEVVVALASVGSSLLIFHRRGVSRLTGFGQDDVTISPEGISGEAGVICPYGLIETDDLVFFVTDRGVYAANESAVAPVGTPQSPDPLWPLIAELPASDYDKVRGTMARQSQELLFFVPGEGVYAFHTVLRAWTGPWDGPFAECTDLWQAVGLTAEPYVQMGTRFGDVLEVRTPPIAPYARDWWSQQDSPSGDAITWQVRLHRMFFGDEATYKSFRWAYLTMRARAGTSVRVDWQGDAGSSSYTVQASGDGTWDSSLIWTIARRWGRLGSRNYRIPMGNGGYYADFTLSSSDDGDFLLSRMQCEAFAMGRR